MNKQQLQELKELFAKLGIKFTQFEQRVVLTEKQVDEETLVLTCKIYIEVAK